MDLDDFLDPHYKSIELLATDRWGAIEELVDSLVAAKRINPQDREAIVEAVKQRESSMSTGIGYEIGLPHAATELVTEVVGAVGKSQQGVDFDALDGKPVRLVLLFLVPRGQFQKHLNALANIAKLMNRQEFRDGLWGRFM